MRLPSSLGRYAPPYRLAHQGERIQPSPATQSRTRSPLRGPHTSHPSSAPTLSLDALAGRSLVFTPLLSRTRCAHTLCAAAFLFLGQIAARDAMLPGRQVCPSPPRSRALPALTICGSWCGAARQGPRFLWTGAVLSGRPSTSPLNCPASIFFASLSTDRQCH